MHFMLAHVDITLKQVCWQAYYIFQNKIKTKQKQNYLIHFDLLNCNSSNIKIVHIISFAAGSGLTIYHSCRHTNCRQKITEFD